MANEINIQAAFTVQRYSPALQGMGSLSISQNGTKCAAHVVGVTTGATTTHQIDGSTNFTYLFAKNLDTTPWDVDNWIEVGTDSPPTEIIARLRAGEFCLVPVKPVAALYAKANGVNADILFCAAQA